MERKFYRTMRVRILGILLGCIVMLGNVLSAIQPVYAGGFGGSINRGKKTYTYASHAGKTNAFSFSIGGGNVTVESIPQEFADKSQGMNVAVRRSGRWENDQFVFEESEAVYYTDKVSFPHPIPLPENDGVYSVSVTVKLDSSYETFTLIFTVAGSDAFFRLPKAYDDNAKIFQKRCTNQTALWAFTRPYYYKKGSKEDKIIQETAEKIVNQGDSDYEKARKVHDWVANNIWYDYDYFKTNVTDADPVKVLKSRKTICGGYAKLMEALLRSLNIPARYVTGKAGNASHAWTEVYADGRWMIIDTTWDSSNTYKNGAFSEAKPCSIINFDMTLEEFSATHTISPYDNNGYGDVCWALQDSLSISKKNLALKQGKTAQITVKSSDKNIDLKDLNITYSSSNKKVAAVSKTGKVKGLKAGTAVIKTTVKMKELGKDAIITYRTKVAVKK